MRRIKIAQIGVNKYSHGPEVFQSLTKQSEIFDVVGFALPENAREVAKGRLDVFEGYREMTVEEILNNPEIEAVTVETEEIHLTKYALQAAKAGKHIHMEKPGGVDLPGFEKLIETVKKNEKVFHAGYMYRYHPYIKELRERVKRGELGEIVSVEAQMNCSHQKQVRQWLEHFPGGMMFFLGCHLVDLIMMFQGVPEKVIPLNKSTGFEGVTTEDFGMAVFEYKNGVSFAKTLGIEYGGYNRRQLVVTGTKRTIEIRPLEKDMGYPDLISGYREVCEPSWGADAEWKATEKFNRYDDMMASFAAMVRGEKVNPFTPDYEYELYKILLKACGI